MSIENTERQTHGQTVERLPGSGRIVRVTADGKRVEVDPDESPLTTWPADNPPPKTGK